MRGALQTRLATLPDVTADRLFTTIAILVGSALVVLGLGLTFLVDEWNFIILAAEPSTRDLVVPFNGHWSALPVISYRLLLDAAGLQTYVPYHALLVATLVLTAGGTYVLARRRAGVWPAFAIGGVLLVFGGGHENYWWAFQIGFVGSVAAGMWGFVLLDGQPTTGRRLTSAGVFALGMTASSPGAILLGGAIVASLVRRDLRSVAALSVPAAIYAFWLVTTRSMGSGVAEIDASAAHLIPAFVVEGVVRTAGAASGLLGAEATWTMATGLVIATVIAVWSGWHPSATLIGLIAATIALFALVALARAQLSAAGAGASRYVYAAAPALAVLVAEVVPWVARAARERGRRVMVASAVGALLVLEVALIANVSLLLESRGQQMMAARHVRAAIELLVGPDGQLCDLDPEATAAHEVFIARLPGAAQTLRLIERFGDPRRDALVPWAVVPPTDADHALARRLLCRS